MSLKAGQKLAHYEMIEPIGKGGMGEVFRARDTKLDRDVAIKVLPEGLTLDQERVTRFEREAKLVAALNHPNVATLHALEEFEDERFLAMEVVLGETLSEMMQLRAQAVGSRPSRAVSCVLLPREASHS